MGVNLGKGIAGLMNIFNPELVILGGTLSLAGEYISLPIKSAIRKYSLNLVNQDTEIKISKLGERADAADDSSDDLIDPNEELVPIDEAPGMSADGNVEGIE